MKPIAAIIEGKDDREIAKHAAAVDGALVAYRKAHEFFAVRRLALGKALVAARRCWPVSGKNAKGWSDFLKARGLDQDIASEAMRYAGYVESRFPDDVPEKDLPTLREAGIDRRPLAGDDDDEPIEVQGRPRDTPPFRQLTEDDLLQAIARLDPEARRRIVKAARVNPKGGSGDEDRGSWCTSREWAEAVGPWEIDPFSNPRSHILSVRRCMLEDGGDAFGGGKPGERPGLYLTGDARGLAPTSGTADELTRVWIQPPYELVAEAIAHYGHTRFCALLRWSPDVKAWFPALWQRTAVVCHPFGARMEFESPPGVEKSGDMPFPHALYYACEADVTDAVRARCIVWRIDHDLDCAPPSSADLRVID